MERFGVPSGGDWALYRGGAVFLDGTENAVVTNGLFERLDGNALFLSGYNRCEHVHATLVPRSIIFPQECAERRPAVLQEHDDRQE